MARRYLSTLRGIPGHAVLVTGACGFVGRSLVRSLLLDDGVSELWLVDDLSTGRHPDLWLEQLLPGVEGAGTAPREYRSGGRVVRFFDADVITLLGAEVGVGTPSSLTWPRFAEAYHLASVVGGRVKIEKEPLQVGIDLAIDSVFFLWAWRTGLAERVLYASSSAAYPVRRQGESDAEALREEYIDFAGQRIEMPDMSYGWSKLTGEYLTYLLASHHGIPCCTVRPFSGYGEDQDLTYPLPAIAGRAARREDPLVVWGNGRQGRDFIHIEDCIAAMRIAIRRIEDGSGVNLGSGTLTTFLEVAALFAELADYAPEIRGTGTGPVGVHSRYADVSTSRRHLDWEPAIGLREGLGRLLAAHERLHALSSVE